MKKTSLLLPLVLASGLALIPRIHAATINYTDGSQANLVTAWGGSLTSSGTLGGATNITLSQLRFTSEVLGSPGSYELGSGGYLQTDFGSLQSVKTIQTFDRFGGAYTFTTATVQTSINGVDWTTQSHAVSTVGANTQVTLDSSVSARYVRLTPTALVTTNRWIVSQFRAFGASGSLSGNENLSVISKDGFSVVQAVSTIGTVSSEGGSGIIDPARYPSDRQVYFNIGTGDGIQFDLGQNFELDRGAFSLNSPTASVTFDLTIQGSTNNIDWTTLSFFNNIAISGGILVQSFDFDTAGTARYVRAVFSDTAQSDLRMSDFTLYQAVPEPGTLGGVIFGLSAAFMLRRKRNSKA